MHDIYVYDTDYEVNDPISKIGEIKNGDIKKSCIKNLIVKCINTKKLYYSIEVTPKSSIKLDFKDLTVEPIFTAITWISDNNLRYGTVKKCPAVKLATITCPTLNHLTCFNLTEKDADDILDVGIKNLFLLKGDEFNKNQTFKYSSDLVKYMKKKDARNELTIVAAGLMPIDDSNLAFLKEKISCGVDFIITQTIFEAEMYTEYLQKCREAGILIPIIPGIFIPADFTQMKMMLSITQVKFPKEKLQQFEQLSTNSAKFLNFSMNYFENLIREILFNNIEPVHLIHFFTMNNLNLMQQIIEKFEFANFSN